MGNVRIGIDIDAKINNSINSQIDALERKFSEVQSKANKGGFGEKIKEDIKSVQGEISLLREDFQTIYDGFKNQKLDTKQFDVFVKSIQSSISDLNTRITDVEKNFKTLEVLFKASPSSTNFEKNLEKLQSKLNGFIENTQKGISALSEFNKMVNQGSNTGKLKDSVEQEVSTFTFKNGGVKVPVTLDSSQLSTLKVKYDEIVGMLNAYAEKNPVDVTMRLFPLNTTKAGTKEVSDAVKNIQAQIASLPEGELKTSMNALYGNLEQQFQKALRLKIDVDLGETQASIKQRISELNQTVKEQGFTIYPDFDISDANADKISAKLTEIQEKLTLNVTTELKTMADSVNALFNNTSNVETWSKVFTTSLDNVETKLNEVVPLINQLKSGITTDTKTNDVKQSVPTESDVNVLIEFTNAMKALRSSLLSQQTTKLNIDVAPLLDKLDNVKATVSMVHTGIGHLQATLANVKNTGGLQVTVETLQRIENILGEINSKQSALDIKVEPEVDAQSFINKIQEQLSQYQGVKVPISVLESSIDSFIQQIQFAVDSRLTNGDIGTESFLPSADSDLGANQVTALNRRIGSLKEKIESVWESWQQFGQAAISGTDFAKEGVVGVSNKLEELSWALQAISNSFVGIDFSKQIGDINTLKNIVDLNTSASSSASNISAEAKAMSDVYEKALQAAKAKTEFAGANKEVLESIINSLSALNSEGKGFENLNKLINNLARNKDDRITDMVANLELLRDALSSPVDENAFINAIAKLASQGERLSDLATVLKASKTQLQNASGIVDSKELSNVDKAVEQYNRLYNAQIELAKIKPGTNAEKYIYYTQEVNEATLATTNLKLTEEEEAAVAEQTSAKKVQATNALAEAARKEEELNQKNIESAERLQTSVTKQATALLSNGKLMSEYGNRIREILEEVNSLNTKADPSSATEKLKAFRSELDNITNSAKQAGNYGQSFSQILSTRFKSLTAYLSTFTSFYKVVSYIRQVISTVQELNTQMIELAKVSDQSIEDIKADFNSYAETAKDLGATISDTISATSDWARMGYNIPDSQELARVALLYKNVGDGIDIASANESLISTLQGYQMTADEAEHIVDVFNEVSNNFAISSGGIGEALQRSAASLNAANTSLEKSVALVTSANTVLQNPESVGTVFKTLSARIRGASTELSDLGEEEDEFTQSTSKLQNLVKSLTGFDILEEDGETFKDIYEILVGIGKEWSKLTDVEQASLGEALAGKRMSNALYAILDNIETLEAAYETAENSAGSAMREQQNYEQGIEYSVNKAKAALEELANDSLSSDFLKGLIDTGTTGIGILDTLIDKVGLLKTVIISISGVIGSQKLG